MPPAPGPRATAKENPPAARQHRHPGVARVGLEGFTPRRVIGLCYAGEAARPSAFVQAAREVFGEMG